MTGSTDDPYRPNLDKGAQPPPPAPPYEQPTAQYGQPQYSQPQYSQPQYGAPQYGQPQYGAPQYGQPQLPPGMFFDPISGLTLPQGTELASAGRRIGAWFLSILLAIVTLGIGYAIWGLIVWGRGQTPALQVLGMRVWRPESGRKASWGFMALREIIGRFVDSVLSIITLLTSFILMLGGKERKTLHDYVAGTVVLYDPNKVLA